MIIAGGKLTTYRRMARECITKTVAMLRDLDGELALQKTTTKHRPLPGADGLATTDLEGVAAIGRAMMDDHGLDLETATHLCGVYGTRAPILAAAIAADRALGARMDPELPYVWAEVDFAATHDLARTIEDVLARRVPLLLVSRDQGLSVVPRVADILGARLGWTPELRVRLEADYAAEVALSRRWRT